MRVTIFIARPPVQDIPSLMRILIIELPPLRADHLGCYGYLRPTSPAIDHVAAAATVFTCCHVAELPADPLHADLRHGLASAGFLGRVESHDLAAAIALLRAGVPEGLIAHVAIAPPDILDSHRQSVRTQPRYAVGLRMPDHAPAACGPRDAFDHTIDEHDAFIAAVDAQVALLLDALGSHRDSTPIVITAAGGTALGEMGDCLAAHSPAEGASRVPLIVRIPGITDWGWFYDGPLYRHDLIATLLDHFRAPVPRGNYLSHAPALGGNPMDARRHLVLRNPAGWAVRADALRYIRTADRELLFDLRHDPFQNTNIAPRDFRLLHSLRQLLPN